MRLDQEESHYDILEVSPSCNSTELREGYQRVKQTFSKDSNALYTMMDTEERESLLARIEQAYQILSDPTKRREYDQSFGFLNAGASLSDGAEQSPFAPHLEALLAIPDQTPAGQLVSIDRVPPMDPSAVDDSLLIAPTTDSNTGVSEPPPTVAPPSEHLVQHAPPIAVREPGAPTPPPPPSSPLRTQLDPALRARLESETQWPGSFIQQIRESQHISIEELSEITKVSKNYLNAIESENFRVLPAPVFVRGFLTQTLRAIKVPANRIDTAVLAYLKRLRDTLQSRSGL